MTQLLTKAFEEARKFPQDIQDEVAQELLQRLEVRRLEIADDAYWMARAEEAEQDGFLGTDEGERMMQELLHAED